MKVDFSKASQLTHIALHVTDLDKSVAFYKEWCGMSEVERRDSPRSGSSVAWMACEDQEDSFVIVLVDGADPDQIDSSKERMRHIGLSVASKDDVLKMSKKADDEGVLHWDYTEFAFPVGTLCAITDPDGHIVEFSFGQPLGRDFVASDPEPAGAEPK